MSIKVLENHILKLFVETLEEEIGTESKIFGYLLNHEIIDINKKQIIISNDCTVCLCLLIDNYNRIITSAVFNLNNLIYVFNEETTKIINESTDYSYIDKIILSSSSKNLIVIKRTGVNITSINIISTDMSDVFDEITLEDNIALSSLAGSTGIMLHDGSGLLLIGDPLQKGRVVTEENGFSTIGSIMIFRYIENESIEYIDEIHTHIGDTPNFNEYFILDPDIKTNVLIYYTADGKGINTSINMKYLLDNIDNTRDKLFNRSLKSNYK